ncbi:hypothetical protein ACFL5N_01060 [bacterium]
MNKFSIFIKCILITAIFINLFHNYSYANINKISDANNSLFIPCNLGSITQKYNGQIDKKIIIIKDLHCNLDVQQNVCKIIKILKDYYREKLKNIYVEGSPPHLIDTSIISDIKNPDVKNRVFRHFFDKGDINGPEAYNILEKRKLRIFGVENLPVYIQNLETLYSMMQYHHSLENIINENLEILNKRSKRVHNLPLKKLNAKYREYELGEIDLAKLTAYLQKKAKNLGIAFDKEYPALFMYLYINKLKTKIDKESITRESKSLIKYMQNSLNEPDFSTLAKYKKDPDLYFRYLKHLVKKYNLNYSRAFPEIEKYFGYLDAFEKLNFSDVLDELYVLKKELRNEFVKSDIVSQDWSFSIDYLNALKSQIKGEMIKPELDFLIAQENRFYDVAKRLKLKCNLIIFQNYIELLKSFYSTADKRNEIFIKNINKDKNKVSVLFTGGYHVQGITNILKNQNISYEVITPKSKNNNYKDLYTRKIHSLSNWMYKQKNILKNDSIAIISKFLTGEKKIQEQVYYYKNLKNISLTQNFQSISLQKIEDLVIELSSITKDSFKLKLSYKQREDDPSTEEDLEMLLKVVKATRKRNAEQGKLNELTDKKIELLKKKIELMERQGIKYRLKCLGKKFKYAWQKNKWECVGIFLYPFLFIATIIGIIIACCIPGFAAPLWILLPAIGISVIFLLSALIVYPIAIFSRFRNIKIIRHIFKYSTMILSILAIFCITTIFIFTLIFNPGLMTVAGLGVLITILELPYLLASFGGAFVVIVDPLSSKGGGCWYRCTTKTKGFISGLLYLLTSFAKIYRFIVIAITFSTTFWVFLLVLSIVLTIIFFVVLTGYIMLRNTMYKHFIRLAFNVVPFIFKILAIFGVPFGETLHVIMETLSIARSFCGFFTYFVKDKVFTFLEKLWKKSKKHGGDLLIKCLRRSVKEEGEKNEEQQELDSISDFSDSSSLDLSDEEEIVSLIKNILRSNKANSDKNINMRAFSQLQNAA